MRRGDSTSSAAGRFEYGQHNVSLRGSDKDPIVRKSTKKFKGADPVKFPLDALVEDGVPCLFYDPKLERFEMRVIRLDAKFFFLYVLHKDSAAAQAKKLPARVADEELSAIVRLVSIRKIHSGEEGVAKCKARELSHDLLGPDTAVVLEYDPRGISDAQLGAESAAASPTSPTGERLRNLGSRVASFFGGSPAKSEKEHEDEHTAFVYFLAGPKQKLADVIQNALGSVDFQAQALAGAKLVQGLFRLKRARHTIKQMTKVKVVDRIFVRGGAEQMLQNVYADDLGEDVVEVTFKNADLHKWKPFTFAVSDWGDGNMTEKAATIAAETGCTKTCRTRLQRFLAECQLFYLAARKFDPVAVRFFLEDKDSLRMRTPDAVLDSLEEDVAQLTHSFSGNFADRRIESALTRTTWRALSQLVRLERLYATTCPSAPLARGIDLPAPEPDVLSPPPPTSSATALAGTTARSTTTQAEQAAVFADESGYDPRRTVTTAADEIVSKVETTTTQEPASSAPTGDAGEEHYQVATEYDLSAHQTTQEVSDLQDVLAAKKLKDATKNKEKDREGGLPCCAC
ncbi:unnamed protein product, partial [Amoebophrya sp. A120]|eukprot:GSA120T00002023001.1